MTRLGGTAVEVTALSFGAAAIGNLYTAVGDDEAQAAVDAAWEAGIRAFDTAPHYGLGLSERRLGAALRSRPRAEYVVSTKVGRLLDPVPGPVGDDLANGFAVPATTRRRWDFSAGGVRRSLEESLTRLGLDRIDIVYLHDPDHHMDLALREALPELARLRAEGVVGAIGAGMNHSAPLTRFVREADIDVVLLAGRYTLLDQRALDDLLPAAVERAVSVVVGGVFNSGLLADPRPGARFDYKPVSPDVLDRALHIQAVCEEHDTPLRAAALRFPFGHSAVASVLIGPVRPRRSTTRWPCHDAGSRTRSGSGSARSGCCPAAFRRRWTHSFREHDMEDDLMRRNLELDGVLFFPVTPFDADGAVSVDALAEHVERGVEVGPGAVFVACGTGEFHALDLDEYRAVVRTAVTATAGRVPVIAGTGGALPLARRFAAIAEEEGADGLLLLPPYLVQAPAAGLIEYTRAVASATGLAVIVYGRGNATYDVASAVEVARIPGVVGFKDGVGDLDLLSRIVLAVREDRAGEPFQFFNGLPTAETTVPAYRAIGVQLYSSAVFCFAPEVALGFYAALSAGDVERVDRFLRDFFHPLVELRGKVPGYAVSLVKAAVRLRGLEVGGVRPPLVDPAPAHLAELERILAAGLALTEEVPAA